MVTHMANDGPGQGNIEKAIAQNEVTLAALREPALDLLLLEGIESAFTSTATKTGRGLEVSTTNTRDKSNSSFVVSGSADFSDASLNPFDFHLGSRWNGDFTISHSDGRVENDKFRYAGGFWDDVMSRTDKSTVSITRTDASGRPIQAYVPAVSEMVLGKDGHLVRDPNGQPLRIAKEVGNATNCQLDYSSSRQATMDCNFVINDPEIGKLSYNETREKEPAGFYYRSVLRDMEGKVLGIVEQNFNVDAEGDLTDIRTSARKPVLVRR